MKPEILSRLTPGCVDLESVARATGWRLTQAEMAAALSGCSDSQMWLAEIKYMGYDQYTPKLIEYTYELVADAAAIEAWRIRKGSDLMRMIAQCSVWEVVDPGRCSVCHGVGSVGYKQTIHTCRTCNGVGNIRLTDKNIASSLGLNINTYRATWKRRYQDIRGRLLAMNQGIIDILARQ